MRRSTLFEHRAWFIVPVRPGMERGYRRWNIVLISALAFIVIGVFVMTLTPELGHATSGTSGVHKASVVKEGPAARYIGRHATK